MWATEAKDLTLSVSAFDLYEFIMTDTRVYNTVMTETENLSTPTGDTVEDGYTGDGL